MAIRKENTIFIAKYISKEISFLLHTNAYNISHVQAHLYMNAIKICVFLTVYKIVFSDIIIQFKVIGPYNVQFMPIKNLNLTILQPQKL